MQFWEYKQLSMPFSVTATQMRGGEYIMTVETPVVSSESVKRQIITTQRGQTRFFAKLDTLANCIVENPNVASFTVEMYKQV